MAVHPELKLFMLLACSPILVLVVQMAFSRLFTVYRPDTSRQVIFALCVVVGHVPMAVAIWWLVIRGITPISSEVLWMAVYSLIVYNVSAYCYFHVFNMSETARRIRILNEIDRAGRLRSSDIESLYGVEEMLNVRLERLVKMRQLKRSGGRYTLDQRFFYVVARVIISGRNLLGFPLPKELYSRNM